MDRTVHCVRSLGNFGLGKQIARAKCWSQVWESLPEQLLPDLLAMDVRASLIVQSQ